MTDQELKEIQKLLEDFFQKRDDGIYSVPIKIHSKQHLEWTEKEEEWRANHDFVTKIRCFRETRKKQVFAAVLTFIVGVGWLLAEDVWALIKQIFQIGK